MVSNAIGVHLLRFCMRALFKTYVHLLGFCMRALFKTFVHLLGFCMRALFNELVHLLGFCMRALFKTFVHLLGFCMRALFNELVHLLGFCMRALFNRLVHLLGFCMRALLNKLVHLLGFCMRALLNRLVHLLGFCMRALFNRLVHLPGFSVRALFKNFVAALPPSSSSWAAGGGLCGMQARQRMEPQTRACIRRPGGAAEREPGGRDAVRRAQHRVRRRDAPGVSKRRVHEWRIAQRRILAGCCRWGRERGRCARGRGWVRGQGGQHIAPALWPDGYSGAPARGVVGGCNVSLCCAHGFFPASSQAS